MSSAHGRERPSTFNLIVIGIGFVLITGIVFLVFSGPAFRLRLNQLTSSVDFEVRSVHPASGGVLVAERASLRQGGEVGRVSFVGVDGVVRSRIFDRERAVLGVTGPLAWTSAAGRPSLHLPSLDDGPLQSLVVGRCGLRAVEVDVLSLAGALRVTDERGVVLLCDPTTGERQDADQLSLPAPSPTQLWLRQAGRSFSVGTGPNVVREGLLDASIPRDVATERALVHEGDLFVLHRRTLAPAARIVLGRYGTNGERWERELRSGECALVAVSSVVTRGSGVFVVGQDFERRTCVLFVSIEDGAIAWARRLGA